MYNKLNKNIMKRRKNINCNAEEKMTARLSKALSLKCGMHPDIAERVYEAALTHDVGKSAIPAEILNKPGKLTEAEHEIMKTHTTAGAGILSEMPGKTGKIAAKIALWHHERYDGEGYWRRFTDELPLYVSIVSVADVYCALIHARAYKSMWTKQDALNYIRNEANTRFNPVLVKAFLELMRSGDFD